MRIKRLTINDYEKLVNIWLRAELPFKPKGRDSKKAIEMQMQTNPDFFLGAFDGDRLVGTVIVSSDVRKGWINRLAVDPDYKRRGIAKALIAEAERTLRKQGIQIFCALIEDYNKESRELFKKCGYVEHHDILYFSKRDSDEI
ncbi:MAG: GNAT family N-acetyltransferase [Candidatus Bathycorpusculaceae bacterium]